MQKNVDRSPCRSYVYDLGDFFYGKGRLLQVNTAHVEAFVR